MSENSAKSTTKDDRSQSISPEQSNIIHRIFGGLFAIWVGFIFSKSFPSADNKGIGFIIYTLIFISCLAILLQKGFSRNTKVERYIIYAIIFISCYLIVPGLISSISESFPVNAVNISKWEIQFLSFIMPFWCITAELSTISLGKSN